jgi:hypothetical protein
MAFQWKCIFIPMSIDTHGALSFGTKDEWVV